MTDKPKNQGEGDRESARRYNQAAQETARRMSEEQLRNREKLSDEQKRELEDAEKAGKARSKGEDPFVRRGE